MRALLLCSHYLNQPENLCNRLFVQYENTAHPETLYTVSYQHKLSQSYFNSCTFVYGTTYIFVPLFHVWCKLLLSKFQCQLLELLLLFTQPSRSYMYMCPWEKVSGRKRGGHCCEVNGPRNRWSPGIVYFRVNGLPPCSHCVSHLAFVFPPSEEKVF